MVWFKVDDTLAIHQKTVDAGNAAMGLWVRAGSWSAAHRTYGHVPSEIVRLLGSKRLAGRLVTSGLWVTTDYGYRFHQWRSWQDGDYRPNIPRRTRETVMARDDHRCVFCGSTEQPSLDHIIRYRDGGADTIENLRVLCMSCNLERERT
jgi:hypothetical protein